MDIFPYIVKNNRVHKQQISLILIDTMKMCSSPAGNDFLYFKRLEGPLETLFTKKSNML